jgi:hypothetical protein
MRSPGVIYRRYRQLKKKIIYDKMSVAHKKRHQNCCYGSLLSCRDSDKTTCLKICGYNSKEESDILEICDNPEECNAFICKWTKDQIIKNTIEELSDSKIKRRLYPELTVMEWILDKDLHEAILKPSLIGKIIVFLIDFLENLLKKSR